MSFAERISCLIFIFCVYKQEIIRIVQLFYFVVEISNLLN